MAPPVAPSAVESTETPTPAEPAEPAEPEASAEDPSEADLGPDAEPVAEGLPEFTQGRPIRLDMLEITERRVNGDTVQSVAVPDPQSRERRDELLARAIPGATRCRVLLALPTFVSQRCNTFTGGNPDNHVSHFVVGEGGKVERVDVWDLFLPGATEMQMVKRLLRNPRASSHRATFT